MSADARTALDDLTQLADTLEQDGRQLAAHIVRRSVTVLTSRQCDAFGPGRCVLDAGHQCHHRNQAGVSWGMFDRLSEDDGDPDVHGEWIDPTFIVRPS